jgi:hypothetical protein
MQDGVDYQVVGVSATGFLIQTPHGTADFNPGDRVRVLPGGSFSTATIAVRNVDALNPESVAVWRGVISSPQSLAHVYAAFQWYVDGKPVKTVVTRIGVLEANKPRSVSFRSSVAGVGTYSVHFWSGGGELKQAKDSF